MQSAALFVHRITLPPDNRSTKPGTNQAIKKKKVQSAMLEMRVQKYKHPELTFLVILDIYR